MYFWYKTAFTERVVLILGSTLLSMIRREGNKKEYELRNKTIHFSKGTCQKSLTSPQPNYPQKHNPEPKYLSEFILLYIMARDIVDLAMKFNNPHPQELTG